MKIISAFLILLIAVPALAIECGIPPAAIQIREVAKAVANTEKKPVLDVDITAPGLALVSYGNKGAKALMTFTFRCSSLDDSEAVYKNPTGFQVISYSQR